MKNGICKLCLKERELCDSHALPDSVFKYIFRQSQGKAIALTDDIKTPIGYSSDSWSQHLLCYDCEQKLGGNFDGYGIKVFRGEKGKARTGDTGITFSDVDRQRLRMFFLSLLWRISISTHDSYRNIDLPYALEEELRGALMSEKKIRGSLFTVAIYRLRDSTKTGGFSQESMREFIISPFGRRYGNGQLSVCFLFFGYFVEVFISKLPGKYSKRPGVISGNGNIFLAPYQELLDVPEIISILGRAVQKFDSGLSMID